MIDTTDARRLAEFYRVLLGYTYRPGDEPPPPGEDDPCGRDWLVLSESNGRARLAFQQVETLARPTWPSPTVPQQFHLDLSVETVDELDEQRARVLDMGAAQLLDRSDDPVEPLYVFADPDGHPFCVFVAPPL